VGESPPGQSLPWRSPISSEAREGPRGPRHAEEGLPRRSQTNRRWSLGVTCSWPLPPWAAEVGPAQHHFSRSGVPHYRHARPGGTTDGDATDDGKRLAPPFRGNTDMGKRQSRIIVASYPARAAGGANSSPMTRRTMAERATEKAYCPAASVRLAATKPMTMAPNGPVPV
jgi:hypothetical protein